MSKKSRERKQKYLAHEQTQEPPPTTGESRKVFSPLTRVRKCEVPDDGFIHPLDRFEPVPPEEMFDQVPSEPRPPVPAEPSQIIKKIWPIRIAKYERQSRTAVGHCQRVEYIASMTV